MRDTGFHEHPFVGSLRTICRGPITGTFSKVVCLSSKLYIECAHDHISIYSQVQSLIY